MYRSLEALEPMRTLMNVGLTPSQYRNCLLWWYQVWIQREHTENHLRPNSPLAIIAPQARANKAWHDYRYLSTLLDSPTDVTGRQTLAAPDLPATESSWLGLVYVMRGSELGNRVLYHHFKSCFSDTRLLDALSFFEPIKATVPWPTVLNTLNARMTTQGGTASVITSAKRVFQWLYDHAVSHQTRV
ncbi:MAG: heme oxygenase-like domain-containing protein [Saccharospirillum sp.]